MTVGTTHLVLADRMVRTHVEFSAFLRVTCVAQLQPVLVNEEKVILRVPAVAVQAKDISVIVLAHVPCLGLERSHVVVAFGAKIG